MLKLVMGVDRVTLSQMAMRCAVQGADREERWILIVPEQFSFDAERRLCKEGGDKVCRYSEVLSFTRMSDRAAATVGGIAGEYLDKGGQLLTMALAAEQIASRIKYYASVLRKPEFLCDMVQVINEFRSYCLEPRQLLEAAEREEGQFSLKLEELGLLYEAYLAVCANTKADPAGKLLRLLDAVSECPWIRNTRFYIDGFSDFTGAELKIIEQLIQYAPDVYISIPAGTKDSVTHKIAERNKKELTDLAQKHMVSCRTELIDSVADRNKDVQALLNYLFSYGTAMCGKTEHVILRVCSSVEDECRAVVQRVRQLTERGARFRDISVVCTDMVLYEVPLRNIFRSAGIKAYFAGERGLLTKPVIAAVVNCLMAAVGSMEYEDVALYLKCGFPPLEKDACDRLDNYAYLWNLRGSKWENSWTFHPRGFGEPWEEEDRRYLEQLNVSRSAAMQPLISLRKELRAACNTGEMVLALYRFLEEIRLREKLEEKAAAYMKEGKGQAAQELEQIYEILLQALEQTWFTIGETERTPDNFARLFHTVLTQYQVATIPAGLDQVHVSDLPDLRNGTTKHLIVLGACDGKFPSYKTTEGILTEEERKKLTDNGVSVAPGRADQMDQELGKICFALLAARESLYMSYSGDQPAWLFRRAASIYPDVIQTEEYYLLNEQEYVALRVRNNDNSEESEHILSKQKDLRQLCQYEFAPLEEESVRRLYGMPITLSPSKIDKFASCRFAFFMNYGLKAKARKRAKLDQPAFGTFVHAVLEHTVLRVNEAGGFRVVTEEDVLRIASEEIVRYAETFFPEQAKREEYLFNRSQAEIKDIVLDVWEELRRSKFQPAFCELKFMGGQELEPVRIDGEHAQCRVIGMVDRVDLFKENGKTYVRIVDYKTGVKDFDYTDILNGVGLQMLIYLFALQSSGKKLVGCDHMEPAGVLYLPAKKEFPLTEPMPEEWLVAEEHRARRKRKGLIRSDENILAAMEEDPEAPLFMPYKNSKRGLSGDLANAGQMKLLEDHVTRAIGAIADAIADGDVVPNPIIRGQHSSCQYCDYKAVCHKDLQTQKQRILAQTSAAKFWEILEREVENHG